MLPMPKTPDFPAGESAQPAGEIVLYQTEDGRTRVECRFVDETLWLSQALIAELFQVTVATVNEHIKNIIEEGEVPSGPTIRKFRIVRREGTRRVERQIDHYNLDADPRRGLPRTDRAWDAIPPLGHGAFERVPGEGIHHGRPAAEEPAGRRPGVPDYFDELLERIRDIRASERRMYLRVREIFALAGDYDPGRSTTTVFFQTIQNRLHFAATGMTAPELIADRADHSKPNMGLTAWSGGVVRKTDVTVAKNYLSQEEISELNRIVTMWLDYAEDQARRRRQVFLKDWEAKLNDFLRFNERAVLGDKGKVTKAAADAHAQAEYEEFAVRRRAMLEAEAEREQRLSVEDVLRKLPRSRS